MQEKKLSAFHPACPLAFNFKTSESSPCPQTAESLSTNLLNWNIYFLRVYEDSGINMW